LLKTNVAPRFFLRVAEETKEYTTKAQQQKMLKQKEKLVGNK
jgi:hypothetical protein